MTEALVWLAAMAAMPLFVVLASHAELHVERLRRLSVLMAAALVVLAALSFVVEGLKHFALPCPQLVASGFDEPLLRGDAFSCVLLPFVSLLWLVTLAATPRARLDRYGI